METADGWLLRIRVPGGTVTPTVLCTVANVAAECGSGIIDVTSRANLQIRGVSVDLVDAAARAIVDARLALNDARADALRAVVASPLAGHDPRAQARHDVPMVVEAIVSRLTSMIVGPVPSKFGVVVDDRGAWSLEGLDADVRLLAHGEGWSVMLRGADEPVGWTSEPVEAVGTATQLCVDQERRMDGVIASIGRHELPALLGVQPVPGRSSTSWPRPHPSVGRMLGLFEHTDLERCNVVAAPFLGRVTADELTEIARLAARHGADLRLSTDHSFAFCGVAKADAPALVDSLRALGLAVQPGDGRASVSACVGSRGCASASADTWLAASRIAVREPAAGRIHLSACAKSCGAPTGVQHLVADDTGVFR